MRNQWSLETLVVLLQCFHWVMCVCVCVCVRLSVRLSVPQRYNHPTSTYGRAAEAYAFLRHVLGSWAWSWLGQGRRGLQYKRLVPVLGAPRQDFRGTMQLRSVLGGLDLI